MIIDINSKKILWEYINRNDSNGLYFMMGWSRRVEKLPIGQDLSFINAKS